MHLCKLIKEINVFEHDFFMPQVRGACINCKNRHILYWTSVL